MSQEQNQSIVKSLARQFRGKTRAHNCFDANVCRSDFLPTRPWETKYVPGDLFEFETRFQWGNHKFSASANQEFVCLALRLKNSVCSPVFTVNRPDRVMLWKTRVALPERFGVHVFTSKTSAKTVSIWFRDAANLECVRSFFLGENDSLHVYANLSQVYLYHPSQDAVVAMLSRLEKLVSHLQVESEQIVDISALPEEFRHLKPLIERWAISDDHERSILVDKASRRTLKELIQSVSPHMEAINTFLDSFGSQPLSDAAALLGTLAECATEAKLRLDNSGAP